MNVLFRSLGVIGSRFYRQISVNMIRRTQIKKVLCVAEKNDAAKGIAEIMSNGRSRRREGYSVYNKIYEYEYNLFGQNVAVCMTSVSGHLLSLEFKAPFQKWHSCNPVLLFDAEVEKYCPENFIPIKRTLEREVRQCQALVIWTDCDREGENIGFEIIDVCKAVKPNVQVFRARFSEITSNSIRRACETLTEPDINISDAVDVRQELDLRIGASFTRFQTLRLQKIFPESLSDQLISYGSCQFPTLGFVVERFKAIQAFVPETFFKIKVVHEPNEEESVEFSWKRHRLFNHTACLVLYQMCVEDPMAKVISVTSKPKNKWRPLPLDTVELEKLASRKLRISGKYESLKLRTVRQDVQTLNGATVSFTLIPKAHPTKSYVISQAFTADELSLSEHSYPVKSLQRRYPLLRQLPQTIYLLGTNFIGGNKELLESYKSLTPDLQAALAKQKIFFQFNPPHAPHFGGTWEREIRSIKIALETTLGAQTCINKIKRVILNTAFGFIHIIFDRLKFKFKRGSLPLMMPLEFVGCIGGCDETLREVLNLKYIRRGEAESGSRAHTSSGSNQHHVPRTSSAPPSRVENVRPPAPRANGSRPPASLPPPRAAQPPASAQGGAIVCNCGQDAILLTVRKEGPNQGRQFYKCNTGDCKFFLWADQPAEQAPPGESRGPLGQNSQPPRPSISFGNVPQQRQNNRGSGGDDGETMCNCNEPAVTRTVMKDGPNKSRMFHTCGKPRDQQCGFFQWANENVAPATDFSGGNGARHPGNKKASTTSNKPPTAKRQRTCGICHEPGHTRVTCPQGT
ncbi:DNA topoisomerase 3-alpha-like [Sinocyclocheilus grahami]|uniref:DNA topoisomerase 3-alpha-like n=1 Tax=Sinocyclocheilus grahami TaxID=75366 RepID=UPI0007AC57C8|nr:PREDICTED: DNA topoisomerase 3-alpha-like [Sinocyclocheilus grahami]